MFDLVGNPIDRFSLVAAQIIYLFLTGNTQPETQPMNVQPTRTETRSTYREPPVYVHRTRTKTRSPYRPTTRAHYSARLDHSDLGDSDSD